MEIADSMTLTAAAIAAVMGTTWLVSLALRDASIVDIVWGFGFVVVAWVLFLSGADSARAALLLGLVSTWGLRLTVYLGNRNIGKGEDYRYQAMRRRIGPSFRWVSLFTVFGLQAAVMWVVSLPVQAGMLSSASFGLLDGAGLVVWTVGLLFEAVGDAQLARFKRDPQHARAVMDRGLWRYTRHPNYFGDFCVWWGIYLVALGGGAWWTVVGPGLMSLLLMRYSGVGLLEKTITSRRPGYAEYVRHTNTFFPGPRRP